MTTDATDLFTCPDHPQCQTWWRTIDGAKVACCALCARPFKGAAAEGPKREPPVVRSFSFYSKQAVRTDGDFELPYYAGGLCEEAGELWRLVKRTRYHGHPEPTRAQKLDELGDALWLLDGLARHWGVSLEEAAAFNIAKLMKRYPNGFSQQKSLHRWEDIAAKKHTPEQRTQSKAEAKEQARGIRLSAWVAALTSRVPGDVKVTGTMEPASCTISMAANRNGAAHAARLEVPNDADPAWICATFDSLVNEVSRWPAERKLCPKCNVREKPMNASTCIACAPACTGCGAVEGGVHLRGCSRGRAGFVVPLDCGPAFDGDERTVQLSLPGKAWE
jgi:NTP pyrophosphatase (non-canonical NTP hydrolase)